MDKYTDEQKAALVRALAILDELEVIIDRVIERNRNRVVNTEPPAGKETDNEQPK